MEKRIFIGIRASSEIQKIIEEWKQVHLTFPVKWVPGRNLHITLVPPWYEPEEDIPHIVSFLESLPKLNKNLEITFSTIDYGPHRAHPTLIWLNGSAPSELMEYKTKLVNKFSSREVYRPWHFHMTLARFRQNGFPSFPDDMLGEHVGWGEEVSKFTLFESRLSPHGSEYTTIAEFPF